MRYLTCRNNACLHEIANMSQQHPVPCTHNTLHHQTRHSHFNSHFSKTNMTGFNIDPSNFEELNVRVDNFCKNHSTFVFILISILKTNINFDRLNYITTHLRNIYYFHIPIDLGHTKRVFGSIPSYQVFYFCVTATVVEKRTVFY